MSDAEIDRLCDPATNRVLAREMKAAGDAIARSAREKAPRSRYRRRIHGADSIRAEWARMRTGELVVHVSWDKDHFYMSFQEFGTVRQTPRRFLWGAYQEFRSTR